MKQPGPDHPITITPNPKRVHVTLGGAAIAETGHALTLLEASYPPVHYIPRADVAPGALERTERSTHCPYKGDASYFSVTGGGTTKREAAWSYETPFPAVVAIAGHLAFYPDRVEAIEELG